MIKRISVLLLLLALSITALFGCSQTKETKHASAIINTDKTNKEENLTPVTLNEVAHSIFYAPMLLLKKVILKKKVLISTWSQDLGLIRP